MSLPTANADSRRLPVFRRASDHGQLHVLRASILSEKLHRRQDLRDGSGHHPIRVLTGTPAAGPSAQTTPISTRHKDGGENARGVRGKSSSKKNSHSMTPTNHVTSEVTDSVAFDHAAALLSSNPDKLSVFSPHAFLQDLEESSPSRVMCDCRERLRAAEQRHREWAKEPLTRKIDGGLSLANREQAPTAAAAAAAVWAAMGNRCGEQGQVCVDAERVYRPHPVTLPYQFLGNPMVSGESCSVDSGCCFAAAGNVKHANPYHLALQLKSGYRALPNVQKRSGGAFSLPDSVPSISIMRLPHEVEDADVRDGRHDSRTATSTTAAAVGAASSPLLALSAELGAIHEIRYHQLKQRLHELQPDMWWRTLPSYAALDATPQLMDNDLNLSFSRVARCAQDSGAVVV